MTYVARFLAIFMVLASVWLAQPGVYAQDNQPPFLDIVNVDKTQAPLVQLSLVGGNLAGELNTVPLKLSEGGQEQTIVNDQTNPVGVQLALIIDPRELLTPGLSGRARQADIVEATLRLTQNSVITRNVDSLAAYTLKTDGTVQTIQDWTQEPNLIFNGVVQNKPATIGEGVQLTDLFMQVLDKFQPAEQSGTGARTVLLFSTGASPFDLAAVVTKASEQHVYIHVVEMAGPNQPASQTSQLQQLAQQTRGKYILLESTQNLEALWPSLASLRIQRMITYQSSSAVPLPLKVSLTLPNGPPVEANFNPPISEAGAIQAAPATTTTVNAANVTTANPITTGAAVDANGAPSASLATTQADAPDTNADTAVPVPANDSTSTDQVTIPGLGLGVPRGVLQLALPILILLLAYFIYRDIRERRARGGQNINLNRRLNSRDSQLYALKDPISNLKPLPKNKAKAGDYELQTDDDLAENIAEPLPSPRYAARANEYNDDEEQNDDATVVPRPSFGDDEATYRLSEQIEQPIIGAFVRVAGNPTLPNEVPIYGLNPARGEARQIHIGRHSKNNTVVINDKSISREHAVIVQKEGRLYLRDNASTAGTFLNGKRLQPGEELLLRHNDLVSFGEVVYEFHAKGEDEATVAGE